MFEFNIPIGSLNNGLIKSPETMDRAKFNAINMAGQVGQALAANALDKIVYDSMHQTYIPHFALFHPNSYFHLDKDNNIERISYLKFEVVRHNLIGNNMRNLNYYLLNQATPNSIDYSFRFTFKKNNEIHSIYLLPGMILDGEGKVLFSLTYKKEFLNKLNSVKGFKKFQVLASLFNSALADKIGLSVPSDLVINENAIMLCSKEFATDKKYSKYFKHILSTLHTGVNFNLDYLITDSIEKHLFNIPSNAEPTDVQFSSLKEKDEYCRKMLKEAFYK